MGVNSLFKIVSYSSISSWDVKNFLKQNSSFNPNIPLVLFGEFLSKATIKKVNIEDNETYKILGVRSYGKGVFVNREVEGKTLKMRVYQQAKPNHLFWCKVDTKNGAFGIINNDLSSGLGSSNMTFAEIDTSKANVDFVQLFFKSNRIYKYLDGYVTGTTNRKYIRPDQLLNEIYIPLPSLIEQNRIIDSYTAKLLLAQEQELQAKQLEVSIEKYLLDELGIEKEEKGIAKYGMHFINFSDTKRWDTDYFLKEKSNLNSKYKLVSYGELFRSLNNGIASRNYANKGIRYLKVSDIKNNTISNHNVFFVDKYKNSDLIKKETLLITRKGTVGQSFFVDIEDQIVASSEIFIIQLNEMVLGNYISEINLSSFVKRQYVEKSTGTIMPSLSQERLKSIKIPLPPIEKQKEISEKIQSIKLQIKQLNTLSIKNKEEAILEFEREIFN